MKATAIATLKAAPSSSKGRRRVSPASQVNVFMAEPHDAAARLRGRRARRAIRLVPHRV